MNANSAATLMPMSASGSDSSHTTGHRNKATMATGQHTTSKSSQTDNTSSVFMA